MSTLEQQETNVQSEQAVTNEGFVEDIVNQQSGPENPEVNQEPAQEAATSIDYEAEAKKFQSMYDRAQTENSKLQQGAQILQLLEQRPDLVKKLEDGIANPNPQPEQPKVVKDDFNPWDAFTDGNSDSGKYVNTKIQSMVDQRLQTELAKQKQQVQAEMQMNNTVNELRNTYKMSDNDVQEFMGFVSQPKEQVGLSNLVKLYRDVNKKSNAPDTAEAVRAAQSQPRTAGVLQGGAPSSPKTEENKVWDNIVKAGSRNSIL